MKLTNVNDYVDLVHEKFPEMTREDIKRILVYGWKMIPLYVRAGNDVSIRTPKMFFFIGKIPNTGLATFKNYCYKLSKRLAYMFLRTKSKWDGYYYFTRSENQYKEYLKQSRKKIKVFKDVFLFKILEEVKVKEHNAPYIFRLKEDLTDHRKKYYPEIRTKNAELIIQRDPLTFSDVMVSLNKYKYLL